MRRHRIPWIYLVENHTRLVDNHMYNNTRTWPDVGVCLNVMYP